MAATSTRHDSLRPTKSCETSSSSTTAMTSLSGAIDHLRRPAAASRSGCRSSSFDAAGRFRVTVRSTRLTLLTGTRTLMPAGGRESGFSEARGGKSRAEEQDGPVNLPASSGRTSATALDAPVLVGMMFCPTPRPVGRREAQSAVRERLERRRGRGSSEGRRRTESHALLAEPVKHRLR